jgi:uncharacterized membrane protein YedE/YeeE
MPLPALLAGILFGAGLALSDMVNPARVLAFLDVAGAWDATLAFVMAGAVAAAAMGFAIARWMGRPLFDAKFHIPDSKGIDLLLISGAALFGIGWGLVGFCPGPAIADLALARWQAWVFVVAMLAGMALHRFVSTRLQWFGRSTPAASHGGPTA